MTPSEGELAEFRASLAQQLGLRFADDKLPLLADLLAERTASRGKSSASEYLAGTATTEDEVVELARALTVSETYFFRNPDQLHAFATMVRRREEEGLRHLRVLSAGCASGEEAYSLAITILGALRDPDATRVTIAGVDVSPDAIAKARAASYAEWALRATPDHVRQRYFRKRGARHELSDAVRRMVCFRRENLIDPSADLFRKEAWDVVFCRNVIMYLTTEAVRTLVTAIARSLSPAGLLFLGHAENLRGLTHDFRLCHTHDTFYYAKRDALGASLSVGGTPEQPVTTDPSWFESIRHSAKNIERLSAEGGPETAESAGVPSSREPWLGRAMELLREERFQEALEVVARVAGAQSEPDALLLRAVLLTSTGDIEAGEASCDVLLGIDDLNAGAHYVKALCREHAGDREAAAEHAEAAAYLDADFAMPHLQLGRLARRAGSVAVARRELQLALTLLAAEDVSRIVLFGGGFARSALLQMCRAELGACGGTP